MRPYADPMPPPRDRPYRVPMTPNWRERRAEPPDLAVLMFVPLVVACAFWRGFAEALGRIDR